MQVTADALSADLLERVLMRLGFSRPPEPTLAGLEALYAAWCQKVPFDNVRKLIHLHAGDPGPLPGDDSTDFFQAWLSYGTGGTCWAGNGGLHAVLSSLGFDAVRGLGTMLVSPNTPPNHGTVVVTLDETRYVVDASILHGEPLRLDESVPTAVTHPAWGVQCSRRDATWFIRWRPAHNWDGLDCRLDDLHVGRETFRERHEQTRPWSLFNYELYARRLIDDCMVGTTGGHRVEFDGAGAATRTPLTAEERIGFLVDEIGMSEEITRRLPPDTPTPPPPWVKEAPPGR